MKHNIVSSRLGGIALQALPQHSTLERSQSAVEDSDVEDLDDLHNAAVERKNPKQPGIVSWHHSCQAERCVDHWNVAQGKAHRHHAESGHDERPRSSALLCKKGIFSVRSRCTARICM